MLERKVVSGIMVTLLLVSLLTLAFNIRRVKAQEAIYIRADGSIDPQTAPIQRNGDIYTLTGNITSDADGIVIQRSNITIDGKGYAIQSSGDYLSKGISLSSVNNVTIKEANIKHSFYSIYLNSSSGNSISGNKITDNEYGIYLDTHSNYSSISGNNITDNVNEGIHLSYSSNNAISGNNITDNSPGIGLEGSSSNIITVNNITANSGGGIWLNSSSSNIITVNNITANNGQGITLAFSTGNTIVGNNLTANSGDGIYLYDSSGGIIYHNNFVNNGIQVWSQLSEITWDDGYPSGGNYWSDLGGTDVYWGPYQNKTGSDGIGDTPYTIPYTFDYIGRDNFPIFSPFKYWSNPILGDINRDRKVDSVDLSQIAVAYGSTPEKPNWNPNCDFNTDDLVSVSDLHQLGQNYGKTSP